MSPVNSNSFTSSLPFGRVPFLSFACLVVLARTSSSVLNKSCKVACHCILHPHPHSVYAFDVTVFILLSVLPLTVECSYRCVFFFFTFVFSDYSSFISN